LSRKTERQNDEKTEWQKEPKSETEGGLVPFAAGQMRDAIQDERSQEWNKKTQDCKNKIKRLKIARMKGSRWKNEMAVGDVTVTNINKTSTFYEFDWKNFIDKFLFLIYQF